MMWDRVHGHWHCCYYINMKQLLQLMNSKAKLQQYVPEMELQVSLMSVLVVVFEV